MGAGGSIRRTRVTARVAHDRGVFMISVAAELAEMHPQTLRMYEQRGLIEPQRSPKGTRLYSQADVDRLRRIQEMTTDWGMNLAGVERVLALEEQLGRMAKRLEGMERRATELREEISARETEVLAKEAEIRSRLDEIAQLERVRETVKAEIVRYEPEAGTALIPIRRVRRDN